VAQRRFDRYRASEPRGPVAVALASIGVYDDDLRVGARDKGKATAGPVNAEMIPAYRCPAPKATAPKEQYES
jgi:hypothetical protein